MTQSCKVICGTRKWCQVGTSDGQESSGSEPHVEGAFSTLRLLFEDHTDQLCTQGLAEGLQALVAKFISFFSSTSPRVRADAVRAEQRALALVGAFTAHRGANFHWIT